MQTQQSLHPSSSTSLKTNVVPDVSAYKGYLIVDRVTSADLLDPSTYKWMSCPSARSARWTAAVFSRVNAEFAANSDYLQRPYEKNGLQLAFRIGVALEELQPTLKKVQ
jgi:hypothetical protein